MANQVKLILRYYFLVTLLVLISCNKTKEVPSETDFCSNIHRNDSTTLSKELEDVAELMNIKTGVYVLEDGSLAFWRRLERPSLPRRPPREPAPRQV